MVSWNPTGAIDVVQTMRIEPFASHLSMKLGMYQLKERVRIYEWVLINGAYLSSFVLLLCALSPWN